MRSTRVLALMFLLVSLATARADVTLYSLGDYMTSWSENGPSSQAFGVGRDSLTFTDPAPGVAKACYSDARPDYR